ncbi:MAG: phenylalanine--tRNA ligase subunit alpha [Christensenellales bacterium]
MSLKIEEIKKKAIDLLSSVKDRKELEDLRLKFLGKKGELTSILRSMGSLPANERPIVGQMVNDLRRELENRLDQKEQALKQSEQKFKQAAEKLDVTLPGKACPLGNLHPLTKVYNEIVSIFIGLGFSIEEGPEVEYVKYNFEMLNIQEDHPSRDEQDTFYISDDIVLRTQTSPVQVRTMLRGSLPIRILSPGRVYRCDEVDATHSPIFHQIEGLVVDKGITLGDLKGTLDLFARELYGEKTRTRLRPSYFPFTEPSAELDVSCTICGGEGCRVCKGTGWIELLGSGMVHPKVLENCGIDSKVYSGFAFGMGLDRVTNMKYGITDIRLLFENDIRFLKQF